MDLDQAIQVKSPKDKSDRPEERHQKRMPELPPVPKDLNHFQQAEIEIYQSQYKNWFMVAKQQEWELLPSLWIGTMHSYLQVKKFMGPQKTEELLRGWAPMSCKGQVQQIKAFLKHQSMLSDDQKKKLAQGKDNSPVEAPQASKSKNMPQKVSKKDKKTPKRNHRGKQKAKGKEKSKCNKPYPQNHRITKKEKTAMDNVFNMARTLMEFKNKEDLIEPILSKEVDLVKLVNHFETCTKQILTKLNNFEYIQQKLGREILQVKESKKTIIGLENMNKDNILSLTQICAIIESQVTLLNQPDDNSIYFIARKWKELRIQVQHLENSTGHNEALFQEQLEKLIKQDLNLKKIFNQLLIIYH
ncbi:hypothetical protein O181_066792 [Austropuccinia psidii MF-1]|uniref:Uncharacterized protein n=1 Tax=Austropuccinia psidii MF-1 TaxID=1389203 RepID=A0A9Q3EW39_9BASI|nr:hypothetical protein [Austropuccinia psidii MF-1]